MNTFTYINNKMNIMSKRKPNKKTKKQQQQKRYEFSLKTQVRKHFFHLSLLAKLMFHNYTQNHNFCNSTRNESKRFRSR